MRHHHKALYMAWQKGRDARLAGKPIDTNPYRVAHASSFRRAWREGWEQADIDGCK